MQYGYSDQGRRNSIISGEATSNIANFFALFPKKLVCQPLISGEAAASPASPVPTPLVIQYQTEPAWKSSSRPEILQVLTCPCQRYSLNVLQLNMNWNLNRNPGGADASSYLMAKTSRFQFENTNKYLNNPEI